MTEVLKAGVLSDEIDLGALAHNAAEQAEEFVRKVKERINIDNNISIIKIYSPKITMLPNNSNYKELTNNYDN